MMILPIIILTIVNVLITFIAYKIGRKKKKMELKPIAALTIASAVSTVIFYHFTTRQSTPILTTSFTDYYQ
jgi:hypothetical protein